MHLVYGTVFKHSRDKTILTVLLWLSIVPTLACFGTFYGLNFKFLMY